MQCIPGGITSILQPCDLILNSVLKGKMKKWHGSWRVKELKKHGPKGHVNLKMPREDLVKASIEAIKQMNLSQLRSPIIRVTFQKCGLHPHAHDDNMVDKHLKSFMGHNLYRSLYESQQAIELGQWCAVLL